jgi:hypothetical protein
MKILVMDTYIPGVTPEKIYPHLREEAAAAWKHYIDGTVREIYFRLDRPGAGMVLECESVEVGRKMTDGLPPDREGSGSSLSRWDRSSRWLLSFLNTEKPRGQA